MLQDVCHWVSVSCVFVNIVVRSFIWGAFSSKNYVLNLSIFAFGMGFNSLNGFIVGGGVGRARSVFGGICRVTGE